MQTRMQFLLYENKYFLVYIRGSLVVSIPLPSLDAKTYMTAIFLARAPAYLRNRQDLGIRNKHPLIHGSVTLSRFR